MINAITPDTTPARQEQTYPYMAVVGIQTHYDLYTTSATLTYRKFGIDAAGNRIFSPHGPYTVDIPDFDAFAMERAGTGDMRWAALGMMLIELGCELANRNELERLAGGGE